MFEQPPSHISRYEITGKIGSGAMGIVYEGLDPIIGRAVAIKLVKEQLSKGRDGQDHLDRFRREMRAAGRCSHPGIVTIFDCGEWEQRPFLVMEYLHGQSLQHMITNGAIPPKQAVKLVGELLDALGVAHQHGVVHRDIKPANIIITTEGRPKITDFGLALLDGGTLQIRDALVGTPSFMAPEQARGEHVDHRADLFSAGILLFRLLTGGSPYESDTFSTVLEKAMSSDRIDVSAVEIVSPMLASVVSLALQKDVSARFQSAEEFAHSLRSALLTDTAWPDEMFANPFPNGIDPDDSKAAPASKQGDLRDRYLSEMRPLLALAIGPIADRVVANAVKRYSSLQAATDTLARHFIDSAQEQAFRTAAGKLIRQYEVAVPDQQAIRPTLKKSILPPRFLDTAEGLLSSFIGPVSGIVIRQSLADLTSGSEFADRLAIHIVDEKERVAFLTRLRELMTLHDVGKGAA
ncbi:serine/threonine-protein kinase [Pararhizobium arenae]|uniref:serine/threonine-protein kinase n=1 Tax=Pararhizobium arenae TaxID=1856850 RepID=UPI00094AE2EE|nr:serine/threonine-protein kinase [Pararhizobium arenae]